MGPSRNSAITCGTKKLNGVMGQLPDGEKILNIRLFVFTSLTTVTNRHTDRQTQHDGIGRAYSALPGKDEIGISCIFYILFNSLISTVLPS